MLTLFAIPKPFRRHIATIQRNAIASWTLLQPPPEIILFGDEPGTAEAARELGVRHVPEVVRNEFGTPLLRDLFAEAEEYAHADWLCYVNADIILLDDFLQAVERVRRWRSNLLMVGQRWDVDITEPWDFRQPDWRERLRAAALRAGQQRPPNWIDYFVFSRGLGSNLLPLAIGRRAWDNWLVWNARSRGAAVVDASPVVMAIHQNHDYSHHPGGTEGVWSGEEARRNRQLIGGWWHLLTIEDATHQLTPNSLRPCHRHALLMLKRALSHPASLPRLALSLLARPFRHRLSPG